MLDFFVILVRKNSSSKVVVLATVSIALLLMLSARSNIDGTRRNEFRPDTAAKSPPGDDPVLSSASINGTFGYVNRTWFAFTITYESISNVSPAYVNMSIMHTGIGINCTMIPAAPGPWNYTEGVQYTASLQMPATGNYSHYFVASNGANQTRYPATGYLPGPNAVELRNYTMNFDFTAYGHATNRIQPTWYGFVRFTLLNISYLQPLNLTTSGREAELAVIAVSGKVFDLLANGITDFYVLNGQEYFLVQQYLYLFEGNQYFPDKLYRANYQYVFYKNGTILLNYDYVTTNLAFNESIGITFGDGKTYSGKNFSANLDNKSFRITYPYTYAPTVTGQGVTPATGTQVSTFTINATYQDIENRAPTTVLLELDGKNTTMAKADASDRVYVDGARYSATVQFVSPGNHSHRFHTLVNGTWYASAPVPGPNVTYVNANAPAIDSVSLVPSQGIANFTNFTITLVYRDLDNDPAASVNVVFNASGTTHVLVPYKVNPADTISQDGCTYKLDMRYTNVSFLGEPFTYHVNASDGTNPARYPVASTEWLQGPSLAIPFNYTVAPLLHYEWVTLDNKTEIGVNFLSVGLPFQFPFYGSNYSGLFFSTKGFVSFGPSPVYNVLPVPGGTRDVDLLSIILLQENFYYNTGYPTYTRLAYQLFPDKAVFEFISILYLDPSDGKNYLLGDFQLVLCASGDIIFNFDTLAIARPGGVNLGNGHHYTNLPVTGDDVPLDQQSYVFSPPRANANATVTAPVAATHYKTIDDVPFTALYTSPANIPLSRATCTVSGHDYLGNALNTTRFVLDINEATFTGYTTGATVVSKSKLGAGIYTISYSLRDIYGNTFSVVVVNITVNDPPAVTIVSGIPRYGGDGRQLQVQLEYTDPENIAPEYLVLTWDGTPVSLVPNVTVAGILAGSVLYTINVSLTHGEHTYSIVLKDKYRPEITSIYVTSIITVYYLPEIVLLTPIPTDMLAPGTLRIRVVLTSPEGFAFLTRRVIIDGETSYYFTPESGSLSNAYYTDVPLGDGTHRLVIEAGDGYNIVYWPEDGMPVTVAVINLPLILIITGSAAGAAIVGIAWFQRSKRNELIERERLRRVVASRQVEKQDKRRQIEEKRQERLKESEEAAALDAPQPTMPSPITKSATLKKTIASSSGSGPTVVHAKTASAKGGSGGGGSSRDKSKFAPRTSDDSTILNKTVLKEYLARQYRDGNKELHYLKIKNDLNVISRNKSSKLYRILQELVDKGEIVRKGSVYIIVG